MSKINKILSKWLSGDLHSLRWFEQNGVEQRTAFKYFETGSLDKIASGIYVKRGDSLKWTGVVRLLQEEFGYDVHVGGYTALALQGAAHQLPLGNLPIELVSFSLPHLPKWVGSDKWDRPLRFRKSSMFKENPKFIKYTDMGMTIIASPRELAILELFETAKILNSLEHLENQLQGMLTLRPDVLQELLETCHSVKVKRLFLYLSEKLEMPFLKKINPATIHLGSGKRVIVKGGVLDKKYLITVPAQGEDNIF